MSPMTVWSRARGGRWRFLGGGQDWPDVLDLVRLAHEDEMIRVVGPVRPGQKPLATITRAKDGVRKVRSAISQARSALAALTVKAP